MAEPHHEGPFSMSASPHRAGVREATMELVLERGIDFTTIEAVIERAGVARASFDRDFADLRDCCLQVYLANIAEFDRVVFRAGESEKAWRDRLRAVAYAAARYLQARPLETRFDMIQMLAVGDMAQARRDRYVERIVDLIDEGRQELAEPDSVGRSVAEAAFGSIYELLAKEVHTGRGTSSAAALVPELMYIAVRPYLGRLERRISWAPWLSERRQRRRRSLPSPACRRAATASRASSWSQTSAAGSPPG